MKQLIIAMQYVQIKFVHADAVHSTLHSGPVHNTSAG